MPIGIISNVLSVVAGGIIGAFAGNKISDSFKENLNMMFGVSSMAIGVSSIVLMENMPVVIFSVIVGTAFGLVIRLGDKIQSAAGALQRLIARFIKMDHAQIPEQEFMDTLITVIVIFCASGTGIYGSMVEGMSGEHSILIAKSVLDLFTALIFACTLGMVVAAIAGPQFIIFMILFLCAGLIFPLTTPAMVNDFKACGGILMVATGFRVIKVKMFPTADMIPAMIMVMPLSWLWTTYVVPLLG